nr:hypothetical protein [Tanacetum cinerariifolium]
SSSGILLPSSRIMTSLGCKPELTKRKWWLQRLQIRDVLWLDDAEGVDCLANKEIFAELAHIEDDKKDEEAKEDEPAKVQEVVDVVTTAKLITEVVTAAIETITAASVTISAAKPQVPAAIIAVAPSRRRK